MITSVPTLIDSDCSWVFHNGWSFFLPSYRFHMRLFFMAAGRKTHYDHNMVTKMLIPLSLLFSMY